MSGSGAERGRNFEQAFYRLCDRNGVHLSERAGARTVAGRRSASSFLHEVDAAVAAPNHTAYWELKHLAADLDKNELLIFHGKALDFLLGGNSLLLRAPMLLFVLSGHNLTEAARHFSIQWGIMVIEPGRLPLPLLYEAVARGAQCDLSPADCRAVRAQLPWACRPLQSAVADLANRCQASEANGQCRPISERSGEILDLQEQVGSDVMDCLDERFPDWLDELAEDTWVELGGW